MIHLPIIDWTQENSIKQDYYSYKSKIYKDKMLQLLGTSPLFVVESTI